MILTETYVLINNIIINRINDIMHVTRHVRHDDFTLHISCFAGNLSMSELMGPTLPLHS